MENFEAKNEKNTFNLMSGFEKKGGEVVLPERKWHKHWRKEGFLPEKSHKQQTRDNGKDRQKG